ncbi:MAG: GxxExxY protein [Chitinophagaceae bacterium]|nr:MAG: GxxExxY protein [Chitinophagaceae bacterium]
MDINDVTGIVLDASIKIHTTIGPGCFERVYEEAFYYELTKRNLHVQRQVLLPLEYEEIYIEDVYKLDLLVENRVVIEIKSVEKITGVHFKRVRTYLKLSKIKNGILLNFNVEWLKDGFHRVFNNDGE